jgi:hypothetical protein
MLTATSDAGTYQGFQLTVSNDGASIEFQTWGADPYSWQSFALGFDSTAVRFTLFILFLNFFYQIFIWEFFKLFFKLFFPSRRSILTRWSTRPTSRC